MSILVTEQEIEELLSYKDQYEDLKHQVDSGLAPWVTEDTSSGLHPRVQRSGWLAVTQMLYLLNTDLDAELANLTNIGRDPPVRVSASVEDVEVTNRLLRSIFGVTDLVVEVHNPPARCDPNYIGDAEVCDRLTYRPVRGLHVVVEVIEYGRVSPPDLVKIEFLASLASADPFSALQRGLDSKYNEINEVVASPNRFPLTHAPHQDDALAERLSQRLGGHSGRVTRIAPPLSNNSVHSSSRSRRLMAWTVGS